MTMNNMRVRFDPALCISGLFRTEYRGGPSKPVHATQVFGGRRLRWESPDCLGVSAQSALLAVVSLSYGNSKDLAIAPTGERGQHLRSALLSNGGMPMQGGEITLDTTWNALRDRAGYKESGFNHKHIKSAIARLAATTLWVTEAGGIQGTKILAFHEGSEGNLKIALCSQLAAPTRPGHHYVEIRLDERQKLASPLAKLLHSALSGSVRIGASQLRRLSTLVDYCYGGLEGQKHSSDRFRRVKKALKEIGELENWHFDFKARRGSVKISRLKAADIHDRMEQAEKHDATDASRLMHQALKIHQNKVFSEGAAA